MAQREPDRFQVARRRRRRRQSAGTSHYGTTPTTADGGSSTDPRPALEDAAIVIHPDGYELIEVDDTEPTESEAVQRQIDALPDDPGGAAFNAA